MRISNKAKYYFFYALGLISCMGPSAITICQLFPLWKEESYATLASGITVSGMALFLLLLNSTPLLRVVKSKVKTPSAWMMWLIGAIVCFAVEKVIADLYLVCFVSFLGSLLGSFSFIWARRYSENTNDRQSDDMEV